MLRPPRGLRRAVPLLIAAGLGGGAALAGAEGLGVLDDSPSVSNTVESVQPAGPGACADNRRRSVSDIYERSGPGVVQNPTTTVRRVDTDPYGGVMASGLGRVGVRYAIEEMSEPRMLVLNLLR